MPFLRCAAGRVHYAERGEARSGVAPVLLVHGAGGSSAGWSMVLARLARVTRAVAVDLPGHGPSEPLAGEVTLARYRDVIGQTGALLGLGRAVLVGHSMGALLAVLAAAAWPDHVAGLVLCGAAPRLPLRPDLLRLLRDDDARFPAWLAATAFGRDARPALLRGFVAAGIVASGEVTMADFLACEHVDVGRELSALRCPVLWLDGAEDAMVPAVDGRAGEIRRLPGVGHMLPLEAPAQVAEAAAMAAGAARG